MRLCAFDGCEQPRRSRGWCAAHYQQYMRAGLAGMRPVLTRSRTLAERFERLVDRSGDCHLWLGAKATRGGYGRVGLGGGRTGWAHRVAWELAFGPIPEGMLIDHTCFNGSCVNPAHLRLATPKQNAENRSAESVHASSGVRGVIVTRWGTFAARVGHHGRTLYAGTYKTLQEADRAARTTRAQLFTHSAEADGRE